jgi:hypothetical protein
MALEMDLPAYTAAAKLMYIKLPMYLFFYMALGLKLLGGKSVSRAIYQLYFCTKSTYLNSRWPLFIEQKMT